MPRLIFIFSCLEKDPTTNEKDFKMNSIFSFLAKVPRIQSFFYHIFAHELIYAIQSFYFSSTASKMDRTSPQIVHEAIRTRVHVVSEGDTVVLHCPIEGWPLPFITWTRYPRFSQESSSEMDVLHQKTSATWSGYILILHRIEAYHAGKYRCSASNPLGRSNFELELIVRSEYKSMFEREMDYMRLGSFI